MYVTVPGVPEVGARQLEGFEPDTLNGAFRLVGVEGAVVRIVNRSDPLRSEIYTPVGEVDLQIDEVSLPGELGLTYGTMRGSVAFEAAGLVVRLDPTTHAVRLEGAVADTTLPVYVEFQTDLFEWLTGLARLDLTRDGETFTGFASTTARLQNGGVEFGLSGIADAESIELPDELLLMHTRIEATEPGTIPVDQLDGDTFDPMTGAPGTWSYAHIVSPNGGVPTDEDTRGYGYSTGSHVTLSEYRAPTATLFGMMRGTYEITYTLRDANNEPTGETLEATAEFLLPIQPTCGVGNPDCQ